MIWKTIPGFSRYEASDTGLIRVAATGRLMRLHVSSHTKRTPYLRLTLWDDDGKQRNQMVHVLVCTTFHGPRPADRPEVRHLDGDSFDNRASMLCWGTRAENQADIIKHREARNR